MSSSLFSVPGLLGAAFLGLGWLIPNHYFPWTSFYNDFSAAIGLLIIATYAVWINRGDSLRLPLPLALLGAIALLPVVQVVLGQIHFSGDGWIAAIYLAGLALAYTTGFLLGRRETGDLAEFLAWLLLIGALISAFLALLQWLRVGGLGIWVVDLRPGGRPYANLAQFNNLATLLVLGVASVIYLFERSHVGPISAWLCAGLLIVGVAMTQSRTPWVASIVLLIWWAWKRRAIGLRSSPWAMVAGAIGYGALAIAWPRVAQVLYLASVPLDERLSVGLRPIVWRQLLDAATLSPWVGFGWNQVSVAQVQVAQSHPASVLVEHSHSIAIDLLLWNGIPLGALIIAALAYWGVSRAMRCITLDVWFCLLAVAIVLVHGMLEFPLEYAYFLVPVGIAAGLVDAQQATALPIRLPLKFAAALIVIALVVLGWTWVEYRAVEEAHRQMRFELARIGPPAQSNKVPNVIVLSQLREFVRFARTHARPGMTDEEIDWMRRVAHRYPYPPALFRYALALALNGKAELAELEMIRLRQLHGPAHYNDAKEGLQMLAKSTHPQLHQLILP